jgi:DNA-binding CsgD family transcriptional regulator
MARLQSCAAAQAEGDRKRAKRLLQEGLKLSAESGDQTNIAYSLDGLAATALPEGRLARACGAQRRRCWRRSKPRRTSTTRPLRLPGSGMRRPSPVRRRSMGDVLGRRTSDYPRARQRVRLLKVRGVGASHPRRCTRAAATTSGQRTGRLAARKQEIALPVGRGLSNRQIAQELSISERTAENHVGRILKKQGFSSRARNATWVAQRSTLPIESELAVRPPRAMR